MAALMFLLGLAGLFTPLGSNLEYEYVLILSVLTILLIPALVYGWPFSPAPTLRTLPRRIIPEACLVVGLVPVMAMSPGLLALSLQYCACGPQEFLFWMAVQWLPAWFVSYGFWAVFNDWRENGLTRRRLLLAHGFLLSLLLVQLAMTLWFLPQKRITHVLAGFLHGPIYDTWIPVDAGILWLRLSHLTLGLTLWFWVVGRRGFRGMRWMALGSLGVTFLLHSMGQTYSSAGAGIDALQKHLSKSLRGEGFVLHHAPSSQGLETPPALHRLYREVQFHLNELGQQIPPPLPIVHIFVYPDDESKKLWFGGGATDVADVWTPSIHIAQEGFPHPTLRHELVHALASRHAFHGLGFHPNMMFTEGLAVALAPEDRPDDMDEGAAFILGSGRVADVQDLLSPLFWGESGPRSYTLAGSLLQYIIRTHGTSAAFKLYAGKSWEESLGDSQQQVLAAWKSSLQPLYDPQKASLQKEALYRSPGVLRDLCPHTKATRRQTRKDEDWILNLRQPNGWKPEEQYWDWRRKINPDDPDAVMNQWRRQARDAAASEASPDKRSAVLSTLGSARQWPPKTIEDIEISLMISDLAEVDETSMMEAEKTLLQMMALPPHVMSDTLRRQVQARLWVMQNIGPRDTPQWLRYLAGWRALPPESPGEPWLFRYLRLRKGEGPYRDLTTLTKLLQQIPDADTLSPSFQAEWYRFLGQRLAEAGGWDQAAQAYEKAASFVPAGQRALILQWGRLARHLGKI